MLKQFELENMLDDKLSKYDDAQLNQLYLRVFNTDDGLLVLRDISNRCFVGTPTQGERTEGMRDVYLSIVTRMKKAVTREVDHEES